MNSRIAAGLNAEVANRLIQMEKATVAAFKAKDEPEFVRHFSAQYIGVAGDGIKTAADEVRGMLALDLSEVKVEDANATFPTPDMAIVTYTMVVDGHRQRVAIHLVIYTSTVYAKRDGAWKAVLHTESVAQ